MAGVPGFLYWARNLYHAEFSFRLSISSQNDECTSFVKDILQNYVWKERKVVIIVAFFTKRLLMQIAVHQGINRNGKEFTVLVHFSLNSSRLAFFLQNMASSVIVQRFCRRLIFKSVFLTSLSVLFGFCPRADYRGALKPSDPLIQELSPKSLPWRQTRHCGLGDWRLFDSFNHPNDRIPNGRNLLLLSWSFIEICLAGTSWLSSIAEQAIS